MDRFVQLKRQDFLFRPVQSVAGVRIGPVTKKARSEEHDRQGRQNIFFVNIHRAKPLSDDVALRQLDDMRRDDDAEFRCRGHVQPDGKGVRPRDWNFARGRDLENRVGERGDGAPVYLSGRNQAQQGAGVNGLFVIRVDDRFARSQNIANEIRIVFVRAGRQPYTVDPRAAGIIVNLL